MKLFLFLLLPLTLAAQSWTHALSSLDGLKTAGAKAEAVTYKGKPAVRITAAAADGNVIPVAGPQFRDGTIEIEVAGDLAPGAGEAARGFVGLAFRVLSDSGRYECFYLRPTNGRANDQVRRNHSLQYVSEPEFPWHRLRKESPEKYESYADLVPGEWTRMRIEVRGSQARLYVNGAEQPSLIVNDLKLGAGAQGGIALWIGPGTLAHFANLKVTAE